MYHWILFVEFGFGKGGHSIGLKTAIYKSRRLHWLHQCFFCILGAIPDHDHSRFPYT